MLFASLGFHALVLAIPIHEEKKAEPPKNQEPVKLAKLEARKPTAPPMRKQTNRPTTPAKPARARRINSIAPPSLTVKSAEPEKPKAPNPNPKPKETPQQPANSTVKPDNSEPTKPLESEQPTKPTKGGGGDGEALAGDDRAIASEITSLQESLVTTKEEQDAIPKGPQELAQEFPDDHVPFFYADAANGKVISKSLKYIEYIPRLRPEDTRNELSKNFSAPDEIGTSPIGEYGGAPLYEMKKGSSVRYLSFVEKNLAGTLVVLWDSDPRALK